MSSNNTFQPSKLSVFVSCNHYNAENPLWHPHHKCLYWSDIPAGKLFRYSIGEEKHECVHSGEPIGGFTIQTDGSLLLFRTKGRVELWKDGEITVVIDEIPAARETRFNDVIADPKGRVFAGTMATDGVGGRLYLIDNDGSYQSVVEDLTIPNGMGFSTDYRFFYMTDSYQRAIYKFDYDMQSGTLRNRVLHILTPENAGVPDGMTIDSEECLWSARWDGGAIYRYDPNGKEILRVDLPVERASSLTFGGENYTTLFVSSARPDDEIVSKDSNSKDVAGNIFCWKNPPVRGRPESFSKVLLA